MSPYERGAVAADGEVHAVRNTVRGPVALCGAGAITQHLPGRFDPDEASSCLRCAAAATSP